MDYREAEKIIQKSWNDVYREDIDYSTFHQALTHLRWCGYRADRYSEAIKILSKPEYLELIMSKFYDGVGYSYSEESILKEVFKPYWKPGVDVKELVRLRDKYKLDDFELECLIVIDDFIDDVKYGGIMVFDGHGEFVVGKKRVPVREFTAEECLEMKAKGCEFVLWYNK